MATETRWFLTRIARVSQTPEWRLQMGRRGFLPGFLPFLARADAVGQAGTWFGHAPVHALGITLAAITFDTEKISPERRTAVWAKLEAAPDAECFDTRADLATLEGSWARRDAFAGALQARLLDPARFRDPTKDLGHHYREVARALMLYGALGRHFHPVDLDAPLSTIAGPGLTALAEHLEEIGFPTAKLPAPATTFRAFYRAALADAWCDFGLDSGAWFLGHPSAHLRKR